MLVGMIQPIPPSPDAPWLDIARGELGVTEVPGPGEHNPRILLYHSATRLHASADEVPWCAAFACWCLESVGIDSPQSAAARDFLHWGVPLLRPRPGAIMIYSSERGPNAGHVGFYVLPRAPESSSSADQILGGNQRNRVCIAPYERKRLIGMRWPAHPIPR